MNDISKYEFIDVGVAKGGTIDFCRGAFGTLGKGKALGIDINKTYEKFAQNKYDFLHGDFLDLELEGKVKFISMGHFLEHLPNLYSVRMTLRKAYSLVSEFVFFTNPSWDNVDYLKSLGLKFYWAEWLDHAVHVTTMFIHGICVEDELPHSIFGSSPCYNSLDPDIHPLESPVGAHYNKKIHPPKKIISFDRPVYKMMSGFLWKKEAGLNHIKMYLNKNNRLNYHVAREL